MVSLTKRSDDRTNKTMTKRYKLRAIMMRHADYTIHKIEKKLRKTIDDSIRCSRTQDSIRLEGHVESWEDVVRAGYIAAKSCFKEVVNDIFFDGNLQNIQTTINDSNNNLSRLIGIEDLNCDLLIIGAGIIGASIAREMSKYELDIMLIDKAYDVGIHTSSRNDGMIHPGIAAPTKSLKGKLNIRSIVLYEQISKEFGVPIRWCGSYILFRSNISKVLKPLFFIKAKWMGMKGLRFLNKNEVYTHEPHLSSGVKWGVLCENSGVASPFKMTVAYAENAIQNGVALKLNTEVLAIEHDSKHILSVKTNQGIIRAKCVINAAGVYTDVIAQMADDRFYSIHPRKGEVVLFDKKKAHLVNGILGFIGDRSSKNTKGGGIIKTYEGNILIGPNAIETPERENYETDMATVKELLRQKLPQIDGLTMEDDITYFTGIRAATYKEDFIIERSNRLSNFIHVAGIQSPGFASAPGIAERVESIIKNCALEVFEVNLIRKTNWNPIRKPIPELATMSVEERKNWIEARKEYGEIICRCEEVSKGEIVDALSTPIPVETIDGVKRRVRAGMGRCQGGFCMPLVMEIIHDIKSIPIETVTKKSGNSKIAVHETKHREVM